MRKIAIGAGAVALAALGAGAAQAGTLWIANMTPAKEAPPNNTSFSGTSFLVLNTAETQASVTATHNIPANTLTGGHIHRAPPGVNGPIILPFPNPASPIGPVPWAIPAADVANLKAGNIYINIHTATFPGGVIRDQYAQVVFANAAATPSQRAAAAALDVSAGLNADLDQALFAMAVLPAAAQAAAVADLGGDTIYAQGRQPAEGMQGLQETIFQRVQDGVPEAQGFGVFGALDAQWGRRDSRDGQAGSRIRRQSILAGVQYAWASGQAAGLAIGYVDGEDKFRNGGGETEAKTTSIQAFVTVGEGVRMTAVAGYGKAGLDTRRNLPGLARIARASPDAKIWAAAGKVSAPWQVGTNMTLSPYAQLDFQRARVDSYVESGAGALGLVVPKHSYETSAGELGATLALPFGAGSARLQAGWRHLLDDGSDSLPLAFVGSPVAFTQRIGNPGRDVAHIDASIGGTLGERLTASAGYRGLIGKRGNVHAVQVRLVYAM